MRWRVYYGDGSTFSDRDGTEWQVPAPDVQVIAVETEETPRGFGLMHSKDAYVWKEGTWSGCDVLGLYDYLLLEPGPKRVLFGRTMTRTKEFFELLDRAGREGLG